MKHSFIIFILCAICFQAYADNNIAANQLHGTWRVIFDPDDANSKETFQILPNGDFILDDGFRCTYTLPTETNLTIECIFKGKPKKLVFSVSEDKKIIKNPSGTTYVKI